jgi:Arc/MetJ-type ribon-helix-helix transcriptional regulator
VNVGIPESIVKRVDEVVKSGKYGYPSRNDFVREAIREKLRVLGYSL